jgi:hypothetical protein
MSSSRHAWWRLACSAALLNGATALACVTEDVDEPSGSGTGGSAAEASGTGGTEPVGEAGGDAVGNTGGSGGASESALPCQSPAIADGTKPLIVDFEGMELNADWGVSFSFTSEAGVYGGMYKYADDSVPADNQVFAFVEGPNSDTALSLTLLGSTQWGGGLGIWMDGCPNVSVYDGVTFWARGNVPSGTVQMDLQTADTRSVDDGGLCAADPCTASSTELAMTNTWTEFQLPWSSFTGGSSGGTAVTETGVNLIGLEWHLEGTYGTAEDLEIAIDDVAFFSE